MLHTKQKKAVELLFRLPEHEVAEQVDVRLSTLRRWLGKREFADAMSARVREDRNSAERITSLSCAHAAARLYKVVAADPGDNTAKIDAKTLLDLLKGSGVLKESDEGENRNEAIDTIMSRNAARHGETYDPHRR